MLHDFFQTRRQLRRSLHVARNEAKDLREELEAVRERSAALEQVITELDSPGALKLFEASWWDSRGSRRDADAMRAVRDFLLKKFLPQQEFLDA